jgi:hypothetical protein
MNRLSRVSKKKRGEMRKYYSRRTIRVKLAQINATLQFGEITAQVKALTLKNAINLS